MALRINGQIVQLAEPDAEIIIEIDESEPGATADPQLRITDTGQADPAGRYRIRVSADALTIERAASANWATATVKLTINNTGIGFYDVAAVGRALAIGAPTGGVTIDAEARTAINSIRTTLTAIGVTF